MGIPTFNRAHSLATAVVSAQRQQYPYLEIVISDNGSTDQTPDLVATLSSQDPRIRGVRFTKTVGPMSNFSRALELASGDYFMWLADDDWIDPNYACEAIQFLEDHPDFAMVAGASRYYRNQEFLFNGVLLNLDDDDGLRRVVRYYRTVSDNAGFYGICRTEVIRKIPLLNVFGADWLCLAAVAHQGKVRTLTTSSIHRDFISSSPDFLKRLLRTMGASRATEWMPYVSIALVAARDLLWACPVYRTASFFRRTGVASVIFWTVIRRYVLDSWYWKTVHLLRRFLATFSGWE